MINFFSSFLSFADKLNAKKNTVRYMLQLRSFPIEYEAWQPSQRK